MVVDPLGALASPAGGRCGGRPRGRRRDGRHGPGRDLAPDRRAGRPDGLGLLEQLRREDRLQRHQRQVDAFVASGLPAAGYQYVNIDEGWWQGTRDSAGNITVDQSEWPGGMQAIADYIHGKGLKAGIYTDAGKDGCGYYYPTGRPAAPGSGSEGHYDQDMLQFSQWGFDFVKVDWCGGDAEGLDAATTYGSISGAIAKATAATGRPMTLSLCNWGRQNPWNWAPGQGAMWRTNDDIILFGNKPSMTNLLTNYDRNVHPTAQHTGYYNDPDMLMVGMSGFTAAQNRTHMNLWAISGAPLLAGNDLTTMTTETADILKNPEVVAVDQDARGLQGVKVAEDGAGLQVYGKVLAGTGRRAVVLLNRTSAAANITARWADLGLTGASATVRDPWARADVGAYATGYTANVPAGGSVLLTVTGGTEASSSTYTGTSGFSGVVAGSTGLKVVVAGTTNTGPPPPRPSRPRDVDGGRATTACRTRRRRLLPADGLRPGHDLRAGRPVQGVRQHARLHRRPHPRGHHRQAPARHERQPRRGQAVRPLSGHVRLHHRQRHAGRDLGLQRRLQPGLDVHLPQGTRGVRQQVPRRLRPRHRQRHQGRRLGLHRAEQPEVERQRRRHDHQRQRRPVPGRERGGHGQQDTDRAVVVRRRRQPEMVAGAAAAQAGALDEPVAELVCQPQRKRQHQHQPHAQHECQCQCHRQRECRSESASVTEAPSASPAPTTSTQGGGNLPITGAATAMIAGLGAVILGFGVLLYVVARRRRQSGEESV